MTSELIAVVAEGRAAFVDSLRRVWDAGDAVFPLDPRLPRPAAEALLDTLAPSLVIGPDGDQHLRPGGRPVEPGDALVVATSGTTGESRGVVLSHDALHAAARATSAALAVDPGRDRWLACLPLAHVGGLSVVTRALATSTPLHLLERFEPALVEAEARAGATLVSLVATALRRIDPSLFRRVLVGGSAAPAGRPANVVATYGMTETGGGVVYDGHPLAGVEVREVDSELQVRGPMLLRGYRDGTDPKVPGGWYPTGDAGSVADDATVAVVGRMAEVIVTGGEKVWPTPVEAVLARHPSVAEVAVTGRADPEWGHRVVAVAVPTDPAAPPSLDGLRAWVKQSLPAYAAPRELVVVGALPRTALGKVRRTELARLL
ncbi:o-succinylbenzoate--CoA ligase [soil metagenome]